MREQTEYSRPYFCFNPTDQKSAAFVRSLQDKMGCFTIDQSDIIVNVGGDGTLLYAFQNLPDKPNFALKPPGSNSKLFHGHHNIANVRELSEAFNAATLISVPALKADIHMSDDADITIYAYSDVIISAFSAQAVLSNIQLNGGASNRVMAGGIIVATPLGSTARNRSCGGQILNIRSQEIVLTSDGAPLEDDDLFFTFGDPRKSRREPQGVIVDIEMLSEVKRPININFDSGTVLPDGQILKGFPVTILNDRHIRGLTITTDPGRARQLLLNDNFRTHLTL